ncbi:hypothetical protein DM793_18865 [Paenarthrobacter nitroguajacolicus]|uniref:DUF2971 domain-containing protein n=1 Tax=Paenarthrobacter nitroguajacolicus TaxID=211146 RepID=UPI0015B910D5|nr:DUF2971 domain-containing protein [Paenarthrobacter nitroguajacolicus]NWL13331.1 hypothetical protein [Paenarthrobacter nitroguajacolicus]
MPEDTDREQSEAAVAANRELFARFRSRLDYEQVYDVGAPEEGEIPRVLYHYTTVAGLSGIISSKSFWASSVRYMNDASETTYAEALIHRVVSKKLAASAYPWILERIPIREGFANPYEFGLSPFIVCFCEDPDLLSQWRAYGVGTAGVSIGIDIRTLDPYRGWPANSVLAKVCYDSEQQVRRVEDRVERWLGRLQSLISDGMNEKHENIFWHAASTSLREALADLFLTFKDPAFREENEWRLIKLIDLREELRLAAEKRSDEQIRAAHDAARVTLPDWPEPPRIDRPQSYAEGLDIRFRPSAMGLIPYVEIPLVCHTGNFSGRLPLVEVVHGPSSHREISFESLRLFLEVHGYGAFTEVRDSMIPLRR